MLQAAEIDDFFSEEIAEKKNKTGKKVQLASFEIGVFKPEEIKWEIKESQVFIRGQKQLSTNRSVVGSRFERCISIPTDISADTVTVSFNTRDGVLVIEGCKKETKSRKIQRHAFFSDSHFSISIDLGDENPCSINSNQTEKTIELF